MRRYKGILIIVVVAAFAAGCGDPYSQRRIALRRESAHFATETIRLGEEHRREFRQRTRDDMNKWWRTDTERFNHRVQMIGDYVW